MKRSRLKLKTPADAESIASGLSPQDLHATIKQRRQGNRFGGTKGSRKLLDAVDACAQGLPHTNEASKKARAEGEAMQHHFGSGSLFLTVTFDDENSLLMQTMAGDVIDDDTPIQQLSANDLAQRSKKRQEQQRQRRRRRRRSCCWNK